MTKDKDAKDIDWSVPVGDQQNDFGIDPSVPAAPAADLFLVDPNGLPTCSTCGKTGYSYEFPCEQATCTQK